MSKTFSAKTLAVMLAAGLLTTGSAYAATAGAQEEAPQAVQQATGTCTGTVVDEEGEPLMGATVRVEGTQLATATDLDGKFTIANVTPGAKLLITYVGMAPVSMTWNGQPLEITMNGDANILDEVVIMGYGITQKRTKVTNSIAKVSEDVLTVGANANPAQALAGAVSGVKVTVNSGAPGDAPNITVRGGTNWDGSASNPLIVVDGQIRGTSMSDINPNDIESMDVLKDAGATALYGARAANGVILITTKQGKSGQGRVTLNAKYGVTHYYSGYDWLDARDYLYWTRLGTYAAQDFWPGGYNSLFGNGNGNASGATSLTPTSQWNILTLNDDNKYLLNYPGWETMPDPLNKYTDANNILLFKNTNPTKHNMMNNTAIQDYNLSFSGGNDRGNYYASLGFYDADGALPTTFYKRYNFSFTGGYKISNWLQANSVFNFTRANWKNTASGASLGFVFGRIAVIPPTVRFTDEEGNQLYGTNGGESKSANLWYESDQFTQKNQTDIFQMTQSLTATIIPGLTVKGSLSWYYNENVQSSFTKDYHGTNATSWNTDRSTSAQFLRTFNQTYNLVANFNRTFADKHTVTAILGIEYYQGKYLRQIMSGKGADTDDFGNLQYTSQDEGVRQTTTDNYSDKIFSVFGRAEYDYMDKYLVAATFRRDGYSRLQNNRWGTFPGVSAGWVFTQENFWKESNSLQWWNYGKLRASYGLNGLVNSNVIGWYTLLGSYSAYKYNGSMGYRISELPNLGLRWERTRTFDIGVDFGFLQNRINLIATYYNRLTMDKYANLPLPQTTGFSSVVNNNGSYRNQGIEIEVSATPIRTKDWQWTIGANITYNKNVIVSLPDNGLERNRQGGQQAYTGKGDELKWIGGYQEGQEPMHMIGWKSAGILRSQADVEALGDYIDIAKASNATPYLYATEAGYQRLVAMGLSNGAKQLQPGDMYWKDANGDNIIDQYDVFDLGNRMPHWTGGFNTRVSWKGLSLYARFDMGFDFITYDGLWCWAMGGAQGSYNTLNDVKKTWTEDNPNAKWPRYTEANQNGPNSYLRISDFTTWSGSYLACRELSLSYDLPLKITQKFRCQGLTVSITGQNLGYLKKTPLPLPDNNDSYGANGTYGNGTYNLPRTVLFGLNVTF